MSDNLQKHRWSFFKAGGVYQVKIESGSDIENIGSLDKKLWAALSCPTSGLFFDQKTLDFVDANKDGRIMRDELVQACEYVAPKQPVSGPLGCGHRDDFCIDRNAKK